jgi:hypothetical protein
MGNPNSWATALIGTNNDQPAVLMLEGVAPSRMFFIDLPDGFPGRQSTSIDAINRGFRCCSACKALSDALLK